jgi:hypothetical protein
MDRLTGRNENKAFCSPKNSGEKCIGVENCSKCELQAKIFQKLAQYEETGLIPDEIEKLQEALKQAKEALGLLKNDGKGVEYEVCLACRNFQNCEDDIALTCQIDKAIEALEVE